MRKFMIGVLLLAPFVITSCGGDESEESESNENGGIEEVGYECPEACDLTVDYTANSQGQDTSLYEHSGAFDVVSTDIIFFHDSTIVLKIDNYEGKREMPDQVELYLSLYTKNGETLSEGEYPLDPSASRNSNLLIYAGTGMLVIPAHIADGNVSVGSYSKEKVCGEMNFSMSDESGYYGEVNVNGTFIVEAK